MDERDEQIEKIRRGFQFSEDNEQRNETLAEIIFLEADAEQLGLSDTEVRQLIASTITDPERRGIYTKLYIEHPALPDETIFDHADRALGAGSTAGLQAAVKRWQGQQAFGFPPDYKPGIIKSDSE